MTRVGTTKDFDGNGDEKRTTWGRPTLYLLEGTPTRLVQGALGRWPQQEEWASGPRGGYP